MRASAGGSGKTGLPAKAGWLIVMNAVPLVVGIIIYFTAREDALRAIERAPKSVWNALVLFFVACGVLAADVWLVWPAVARTRSGLVKGLREAGMRRREAGLAGRLAGFPGYIGRAVLAGLCTLTWWLLGAFALGIILFACLMLFFIGKIIRFGPGTG